MTTSPIASASSGLPADLLKFELTEAALISNVAAARETLDKLHGMGFQLMLDDFGTGYSSLSHLQLFPFDFVKIERPLVNRTGPDQADDGSDRRDGADGAQPADSPPSPRSSSPKPPPPRCRRWAASTAKGSISASRSRRPPRSTACTHGSRSSSARAMAAETMEIPPLE